MAIYDEWLQELLRNNNIQSTGELSPDMVSEEIRETETTIRNERLWALGAPTKASADLHLGNIVKLEEYIQLLETLIPQPCGA